MHYHRLSDLRIEKVGISNTENKYIDRSEIYK